MKKNLFHREISLLLTLCMTFSLALGCTGCGGAGGGLGASAASMFLRKTEGTVAVADAEGADVAPEENLGLYSGYTVGTEEESYAWIDLDKVKLTKLDENSAVEITKDGKNLSIDVKGGSLFFNVTEPLADDETMEISTSSMLVGIRGTCGWVTQSSVALLEGTITVTAGDESVTISAGEQARLTQDGALDVWELTFESIPDFVARELLDDDTLQQTVLDASGLRIPTTYEELVDVLENVVYSEMIDFEADGSPEMLVIQDGSNYARFYIRIYRMGPEGPEFLTSGMPVGVTTPTRFACWLVERGGRQYVCCQTDGIMETNNENKGIFLDTYYGSVAAQDGGREDWGMTDYFNTQFAESREAIFQPGWIYRHNEKGFVEDMNDSMDWEEKEAYWSQNNYTTVRELYAVTPAS